MKKFFSKFFFHIKRFFRNNFLIVILFSGMVLVTFFLANQNIDRFSGFSNFLNNKFEETIINKFYNKSLEGTVLDNIFNFNATVIINKHLNILHKEIPISNDILVVETTSDNNSRFDAYQNQSNLVINKSSASLITTTKYQYLYQSKNKIMSLDDFKETRPFNSYTPRQSNRFQGLVDDFKKQLKQDKNKELRLSVYNNNQNWNVNHLKNLITPRSSLSSVMSNVPERNSSINMNIIKYSETKHKLDTEIVKDFSKDPLKSVIEKVLIPNGLPKTPANVNAIAVSMGLPSGSLGSNDALASSLGVSVEDLSDPNVRLPSRVVLSINKNKNYIGKLLDINNTTLSDYYDKALKNNYFSNIGN